MVKALAGRQSKNVNDYRHIPGAHMHGIWNCRADFYKNWGRRKKQEWKNG